MPKVLAIGLDGATFDLMQPWIDAGQMPTLARLQSEGAWGPLRTVAPPITAPAWTSFKTGMNPGRHGVFEFMYRVDGTYRLAPVNAQRCGAKAIWDLLSEAGHRVVVVNVPMTYPPHPVSGAMITGLFTPRGGNLWEVDFTYPPRLREWLRRRYGHYLVHPMEVYARGQIDRMLAELHFELEQRTEVVLDLVEEHAPDLTMVVYNGTDKIGHALMHCLDPQHPFYNPDEAARYGPAVQAYFQAVDGTLARLLDAVGDAAYVMLMSDHGMGPIYRFIYMNNWLLEEGYMHLQSDALTALKRTAFRLGLTPINVYDGLVKLGLASLRTRVDFQPRAQMLRRYFLSLANVHWGRTRAYSLGNIGQIYLNVRDREPEGIVERGEEYRSLRDEIIARLQELRDPQNGQPIMTEIYRREELYAGPYLDEAPDIIVLPHNLEYQAAGTSAFMHNRILGLPRGNAGGHRMEGIWLLKGPGLKGGVRLEGARIVDLAPTLLHLLGLPAPTDMDGRVLSEAFEPGSPLLRAGRREGTACMGRGKGEGYSPGEEEEIARRLADLGYVA
jgi:predicted AlkP superfamily phosphohydrolase/phosphomutase